MGYQIYDIDGRDCGYGVPAECDHPRCHERIDRGLGYLCGERPGDSQFGCGRYFCENHRVGYRKPRGLDRPIELCSRCWNYREPYEPKPDLLEWLEWKLLDDSWDIWRVEHPLEVAAIEERLALAVSA